MEVAVSIALSIATLVLGIVGGVWYSELKRRPLLVVSGGGSGGIASVSVSNKQAWFGISLGPTVVFGKRLFGPWQWLNQIERNPADCTASLRDLDEPQAGGIGLPFQDPSTGEYVGRYKIPCGESVSIPVLINNPHGEGYCAFNWDPNTNGPKFPPQSQMFTQPRRFLLTVSPSNGGKALEVPVAMLRSLSGALMFTTENSRGSM